MENSDLNSLSLPLEQGEGLLFLPLELRELIVSFLDKKDLQNYALVCRAFAGDVKDFRSSKQGQKKQKLWCLEDFNTYFRYAGDLLNDARERHVPEISFLPQLDDISSEEALGYIKRLQIAIEIMDAWPISRVLKKAFANLLNMVYSFCDNTTANGRALEAYILSLGYLNY